MGCERLREELSGLYAGEMKVDGIFIAISGFAAFAPSASPGSQRTPGKKERNMILRVDPLTVIALLGVAVALVAVSAR